MASKKIIFVGNPVPENIVGTAKVSNINIADNIAQNTVIKGLYSYYGEDLAVISLSPDKSTDILDLGYGVNAHTILNNNGNRIFFYLSLSINYTKKLLEILKSDHRGEVIVITNGPYIYMALPVLIARLRYKIKWVPFLIGAIEVPEERFPLSLISKLSRWTVKKADGAITYVAKSVIDYMPKKPFVEIVYLIDDKMMKIYREYRSSKPKKFTVTYTGALTDIYNIDTVIDVIEKTGDKYHWVFAGRGRYADEIKKLSLDKRYDVDFGGAVSNIDAIKLQKSSHLLLCLRGGDRSRTNSYYSKYAASGKLTEYLCSGTPILAGDIPAFSETIKPFMTCEKNQTTDKIINDLEEIERSYNKKIKLAKDGQQYAFQYFTSNYQSKNIYEFLEKI